MIRFSRELCRKHKQDTKNKKSSHRDNILNPEARRFQTNHRTYVP